MVKFGSIDGRNEVLYAGPHSFYNRPMIVKPWTTYFIEIDVTKDKQYGSNYLIYLSMAGNLILSVGLVVS